MNLTIEKECLSSLLDMREEDIRVFLFIAYKIDANNEFISSYAEMCSKFNYSINKCRNIFKKLESRNLIKKTKITLDGRGKNYERSRILLSLPKCSTTSVATSVATSINLDKNSGFISNSTEYEDVNINENNISSDISSDKHNNIYINNINKEKEKKINKKKKKKVIAPSDDVECVFKFWLDIFKKRSNTKLDDSRVALISNALTEYGYSVEDCCHAIEGCYYTDYYRDRELTGIQNIFPKKNTGDRIDYFISQYEKSKNKNKITQGDLNFLDLIHGGG